MVVAVADPKARHIAGYKPSDLITQGEYPFSNLEDNQLIVSAAGNFHYFNSADEKQVI